MRGVEQRLLSLVSKHRERGILIDTNVLLLYLPDALQPCDVPGAAIDAGLFARLVSPMPDWRHWCKRITCC